MVKKIFSLLFLIGVTLFAVDITTLGEAINLAGKQRMYTQRMLKDYAMAGMHNTFGNPHEDLVKIVSAFEEHLDALNHFAKDPKIKAKIAQAKSQWQPIKQMLLTKPNKTNAAKLQVALDQLLHTSDEITKGFAALSPTHTGEIINISGRQRMLSQRMASLYMLKVWGIDDPQFKQKLSDAMQLFKTSLQKLKAYEKNTPQIKTHLEKAGRAFMFFEIMGRSSSKFIPSLIYRKSNEILHDMDAATKLYAKLETNKG